MTRLPPITAVLAGVLRRHARVSMQARRIARSNSFDGDARLRALEAILFLERPASIHPLVEKILTENDARDSVAFRGKVLDSLGRLDDPAIWRRSYSRRSPACRPS